MRSKISSWICNIFERFYTQAETILKGGADMENNLGLFGEVDSVEFAIYLNEKAKAKDLSVNVTKIQKWLYICYGLYLAAYKKQLFNERPKAWDYGPAFPRVHTKQKKNKDSLEGLQNNINISKLEEYDEIIDPTLEKFGDWTAGQLVAWTHGENKAWDKKYNKLDERYGSLDNHDIYLDFEPFVAK